MTFTKQISNSTSTAGPPATTRYPEPVKRAPLADQDSCSHQIDRLVCEIDSPAVREIIDAVFQNLLGLIECLALIESRLRQVDAAEVTFSLFQAIHDEARSLVEFVRTDALNCSLMGEELIDTLDGITFALSHDLQRVFEPNSQSPTSSNTSHVVVGKLYRAHDVLTNCLQQSTITLAMVFDANLVGARLFNNSDMRYRQSLQLCQDLTSLIQLVETSEKTKTETAHAALETGIEEFRHESMECLAYSDWPQFESFCERIALTPVASSEAESALHQFRCYLETLLGQVRMRAVLADVFPVQFGEMNGNFTETTFAEQSPPSTNDQVPGEPAEEQTPWNLALTG